MEPPILAEGISAITSTIVSGASYFIASSSLVQVCGSGIAVAHHCQNQIADSCVVLLIESIGFNAVLQGVADSGFALIYSHGNHFTHLTGRQSAEVECILTGLIGYSLELSNGPFLTGSFDLNAQTVDALSSKAVTQCNCCFQNQRCRLPGCQSILNFNSLGVQLGAQFGITLCTPALLFLSQLGVGKSL